MMLLEMSREHCVVLSQYVYIVEPDNWTHSKEQPNQRPFLNTDDEMQDNEYPNYETIITQRWPSRYSRLLKVVSVPVMPNRYCWCVLCSIWYSSRFCRAPRAVIVLCLHLRYWKIFAFARNIIFHISFASCVDVSVVDISITRWVELSLDKKNHPRDDTPTFNVKMNGIKIIDINRISLLYGRIINQRTKQTCQNGS